MNRHANRYALSAVSLAMIVGFSHAEGTSAKSAQAAARPILASGIATRYIDRSVRPQDDFFAYENGIWLKTAEIPTDLPMLDPFVERSRDAVTQLRTIVEKAAAGGPGQDANARRLGDFYASFMDETRLGQLGITPLKPELDHIAAVKDKSELPALLAHLGRIGVSVPFSYEVVLDGKDATRYAVSIYQSGLGLPNADYYLKADDEKLAAIKAQYQAYIEKMLGMAGSANAAPAARAIVDFETALAKVRWTPVELRDPVKGYNKVMLSDLGKVAPDFDWDTWLGATGIASKTTYVIVRQPSYLKAFGAIANATPLDTWKAYLTMNLVKAYGDFLSKDFADANFDFFSKTVNGIETQPPRWRNGIRLIEASQGEALGKLYVAQYFPAERKARMEVMVNNLRAAFRQSIDKLEWMSPATRKEAQAKLAKMRQKIGYPDKWRDYSALLVKRDDLVGNVMRVYALEDDHDLNKLGKPVDHDEWEMTPQTANAYYSPQKNEIVFPAVMLQPPFFDANADDAVNYGAIGTVIAHEISHGFDDQGSQYDGDGNLRDWWTVEDHAKFKARTAMLVKQYGSFEPLAGYHVNGELSLGETIADNSGLAITYRAYHMSLKGKAAPVVDGFSGDQRLYMGFGQVWRQKMRDNFEIMVLKTDPHPPGMVRANGALPNQPGFYEAFGIKPGDKMYLEPKERVTIW